MRRLCRSAAIAIPLVSALVGCDGTPSGQARYSNDPNDTIRQIKAEEAQLEGQLEAGRREAQGSWGQPDPGYRTPDQMGFQPR